MSASIAAMFCGGSILNAPEHLEGVVQFCRSAIPVLFRGLLDLGRGLQRKVG
jgi:hypothetical protein